MKYFYVEFYQIEGLICFKQIFLYEIVEKCLNIVNDEIIFVHQYLLILIDFTELESTLCCFKH